MISYRKNGTTKQLKGRVNTVKAILEKHLARKTIFTTLIEKILLMLRNNNSVLEDCTYINMNRIFYLTAVAVPMRIFDIIIFTNAANTSEVWGRGIIICHSTLLFFYIAVLLVTARARKMHQTNFIMHTVECAVPVVVLVSGIVIVTIDQLITTSITPFLIVCAVSGIVFLIRPLLSIIIYLGSYLIYYNLIALTITDYQVLLSNRVNGATAVALGLLISVVGWHYNYTNIIQKRKTNSQQKKLEKMAYHDPLTSLYNRHFFDETIKNELLAMERYGHESVIVLLDVDNFKSINDTYGHLIGDQVLVQLAQLITNNVRKSDIISRFGGEEFVILAPKTSLLEGAILAEKLRKLISEEFFITDTITLHITASFGVSLLEAGKKRQASYFSKADKALYQAKGRGKNRVEVPCP